MAGPVASSPDRVWLGLVVDIFVGYGLRVGLLSGLLVVVSVVL